jgi:hypothetical protein
MTTTHNEQSERAELEKRFRKLLTYEPETGLFFWKESPKGGICKGAPAGSITSQGYVIITIDRRGYRAHRLAWLFFYSVWPSNQIDHINRNRSDNRICNLQEATQKQNHENISLRKDNTSGYRGVHWDKTLKKWIAAIQNNRKNIKLGAFNDPQKAHEAYVKAASIYHTHNQEKING